MGSQKGRPVSGELTGRLTCGGPAFIDPVEDAVPQEPLGIRPARGANTSVPATVLMDPRDCLTVRVADAIFDLLTSRSRRLIRAVLRLTLMGNYLFKFTCLSAFPQAILIEHSSEVPL
jgi:hypothetical protein